MPVAYMQPEIMVGYFALLVGGLLCAGVTVALVIVAVVVIVRKEKRRKQAVPGGEGQCDASGP